MRGLTAIKACLLLLAAFFGAPFFHWHEREDSDHVRKSHRALARTLHTHLTQAPDPGSSPGGLEFRAQDEQDEARFLTWFQAKSEARRPLLLFYPVQAPVLSIQERICYRAPIYAPRAHGPPGLSLHAPRGPPA